jgi:iron-sulfur cluster assembly protein
MFRLTPAAADQIQLAARQSQAIDMALRVAARREADGNLEFGLGFDEPREGDLPLQMEGIDVLIGPPSQALLSDTVLDFVEVEPGDFQFVFMPQDEPAPASGGCASAQGGACGSCRGGAC